MKLEITHEDIKKACEWRKIAPPNTLRPVKVCRITAPVARYLPLVESADDPRTRKEE